MKQFTAKGPFLLGGFPALKSFLPPLLNKGSSLGSKIVTITVGLNRYEY
jgi:hypothetical protein